MDPEYTFTRRIGAVLLADIAGFSALTQEDDERTAQAVERLLAIVREIVPGATPLAGDTIRAVFDNVVAAVEAALNIQNRIAAEDFGLPRLQVRIGVHIGDLLLRGDAILGDAINVAARLQALSQPGAVCISDGVYQHVRKKFDVTFVDLGQQRLKNIAYPVHAYLLVPHGTPGVNTRALRVAPWMRGTWAVGGIALAAVAVLVVVGVQRHRSTPVVGTNRVESAALRQPTASVELAAAPEAALQVALGVMIFKSLGDEGDKAWMREALRDGLNTQLSQLSGVKVYSKEFIDFLISREGLTEIEAANRLGIKKMLSGSVVAHGDHLQIETHVVDVASGVLEASYTTADRKENFLSLQNKVVMGLISRLPITAQERSLMLAQQTTNQAQQTTDVDAFKALLAAEGAAAGSPPIPAPDAPRSALPQWFALATLGALPALAQDGGGDPAEILAVLQRYRDATEGKQIEAVAALHVDFPPQQRAAQRIYFENTKDLKVTIDNVDIAVAGDEAVVSYTRTDDFVDTRTGRPIHVPVRLTKMLRRQNGTWKLATGQAGPAKKQD